MPKRRLVRWLSWAVLVIPTPRRGPRTRAFTATRTATSTRTQTRTRTSTRGVTATGAPSPTDTVTPRDTLTQTATPTGTAREVDVCSGDCGGSGAVDVANVILLVNIALGNAGPVSLPARHSRWYLRRHLFPGAGRESCADRLPYAVIRFPPRNRWEVSNRKPLAALRACRGGRSRSRAEMDRLMPGTGLEPVRGKPPQDFKSCVSAYSTTRAKS